MGKEWKGKKRRKEEEKRKSADTPDQLSPAVQPFLTYALLLFR